LDDSIVPALTTTYLDGFLPGLVAKYGDNVPMALDIEAHDVPVTIFNVGDMGMTVDVDVSFEVVGVETAVILTFQDIVTMI